MSVVGSVRPIVGIATASGTEVEEGGVFTLLNSIDPTLMRMILVLREGTERQAQALAEHPAALSVVRSGPLGLSAARNLGLLELRGLAPGDDQIVTFPDDDGYYPPKLLPMMLGLMPGHDLVLGTYGEDNPDCEGDGEEPLTSRRLFEVANSVGIFTRWHVVRSVGGFDGNLGVGSPRIQAGEDLDFLMGALKFASKPIFCPQLQIQHPVVTAPRPDRVGAHLTVALRYIPDLGATQVLARGLTGSLLGLSHVSRSRLRSSLRRFPRQSVNLS